MNKNLQNDPVVMTLDAGGTNFVFSAIQNGNELLNPIRLPSNAHDLDSCLNGILDGFEKVLQTIGKPASAISFAFPGPADYKQGIIGDLGNLPAFRGGVALGPLLEEKFKLPVFINNDGDLFALGEAKFGFLPWINSLMNGTKGNKRMFENLIGLTLGTGFGGGIVLSGKLVRGDTNSAGEVWLLRNGLNPFTFAEENISARALVNSYRYYSGVEENFLASDIANIARQMKSGDHKSAIQAFNDFGTALGEAIANLITMFDGSVVIGGGLSNSWDLFFPTMLEKVNGFFEEPDNPKVNRLESKIFNLEDHSCIESFKSSSDTLIKIPFSDKAIVYDSTKRLGVGVSKLGASRAVALGAYAFAMKQIM